MLTINILMSFDTYYRLVVLGIILLPVLQGEIIRPRVVFTAMPLVFQFVDAVVIRMILLQASFLSEASVAVKRSEVFCELRSFPVCLLHYCTNYKVGKWDSGQYTGQGF